MTAGTVVAGGVVGLADGGSKPRNGAWKDFAGKQSSCIKPDGWMVEGKVVLCGGAANGQSV